MIPNKTLSINEGALRYLGTPRNIFLFKQIQAILNEYGLDFDTPISDYPEEAIEKLFNGGGDTKYEVSYDIHDNSVTYRHTFEGLSQVVREHYEGKGKKKQREKAQAFMNKVICPECKGGRLNKEALSYKIDGYSIADLVRMDIDSLRNTLGKLSLNERQQIIGHQILKEIRDRLDFLLNVGLYYLSLDREAQTLAGGEAQRIRLATQIGTQLVGVLYILDEPSIGLHQRDNIKLIRSTRTAP